MFCKKCGTKLQDHMKFCPKCGTAVTSIKVETPEAVIPNEVTPNAVTPNVEISNVEALKTEAPKAETPKVAMEDDRTEILKPEENVSYHNPNENPNIITNNFSNSISNEIPNNPNVNAQPVVAPVKKEKKKSNTIIIVLSILLVLLLCAALGVGYFIFSSNKKADEYNNYIDLAGEYFEDEDYRKAANLYKEAIELIPDREDAYIGLAETYLIQDKEESAITTLETAYEMTKSKKVKEQLTKLTGEDPDDNASEDAEDADSDNDPDISEETEQKKATETKKKVENQIPASINIRQVDNTDFPNVKFYATISDENGNIMEDVDASDFKVKEIDANGNVSDVQLKDVYKVLASADGRINMNMVLDASGSMIDYNKMDQAKQAANSFLEKVNLDGGDRVEIISFDDYVYLEQEFTSNKSVLNSAIAGISPDSSTALYDALYAGVFQTYYEEGAKCVVGFTDGMENASSYSFQDVVNLAQSTGIPVYIIGIGEEYDADVLQNLAMQCGGDYYSANTTDLATILEEIYLDIYQEQQDYYVFEYTSSNRDNLNLYREIAIETTETAEFAFTGEYRKEFVPTADLSGAFSAEYSNMDYMIPDSSSRIITTADLSGMSLAQLRIARNEIFARHGRQFKDSMLNQWFYSKTWYLNIPQKYAPDYFDKNHPSPLSKLESDNVNTISAYEKAIMETQDIYPNASNVLLSDYDLGLSKAVLKKAYSQMLNYPSSDILNQNLQKVQDAINKEDVEY